MLLVSGGQRPGRLLNLLQCTIQTPVTELFGPNVSYVAFEKSFPNKKCITLLLTKERTANHLLCCELDQKPRPKSLILVM